MALVRFDSLRTINFSALTNAYQFFGAALDKNWRMFKITNTTDADIFISFDSTKNNIIVPAGTFTLYDMSTNNNEIYDNGWFVMQIGTQFYVKYLNVPTSGDVWLEGCYGRIIP